jgi:methylenetetrahydrofolate dehydrogenase (NADP+)/methenyltetrahydrofolate cyclohydrolase
MSQILDGKAVAVRVRADVKRGVESLMHDGVVPGLAVVLVGDDPASDVYVRNKGKAAREAGIEVQEVRLPGTTPTEEVLQVVEGFARNHRVHGILVQMPLPPHVDARRVIAAIPSDKDVDGFTFEQTGRLARGEPALVPCTPAGVMRLLHEANVILGGAEAVVVGRSLLVGKPMATLLLGANATVTVCHSKTCDLASHLSRADVVVAALGQTEAIKGAWLKPGAAVIDVGITRQPDGKLKGDVEFHTALGRAGVITPVPGGVGPMTIAYLLHNTVQAAAARTHGLPPATQLS